MFFDCFDVGELLDCLASFCAEAEFLCTSTATLTEMLRSHLRAEPSIFASRITKEYQTVCKQFHTLCLSWVATFNQLSAIITNLQKGPAPILDGEFPYLNNFAVPIYGCDTADCIALRFPLISARHIFTESFAAQYHGAFLGAILARCGHQFPANPIHLFLLACYPTDTPIRRILDPDNLDLKGPIDAVSQHLRIDDHGENISLHVFSVRTNALPAACYAVARPMSSPIFTSDQLVDYLKKLLEGGLLK